MNYPEAEQSHRDIRDKTTSLQEPRNKTLFYLESGRYTRGRALGNSMD